LSIPLPSSILRQNLSDEQRARLSTVYKAESLKDSRQSLGNAFEGVFVGNLNISLASVVNQLLELGFIQLQHRAFGDLKASFGLKIIFVVHFTVYFFEVVPVLYAGELMVR